jgi:hypothetical protein
MMAIAAHASLCSRLQCDASYFGRRRSPGAVDADHLVRLKAIIGFGNADQAFRLMPIA